MNLKQWLVGGAEIKSVAANAGLALLRVFSGLTLALVHGIGKIPPSEGFISGVAKLGFPLPAFFAWAAGASEFFGGLLLAAGLFTRPASFFILVTMAVAAFVRHAADPFARKEKALMYIFIALAFLLIGAGRYGLDAIVRRSKNSP